MGSTYKKLKKQISYTAIYKIVTIVSNYILIALLIKYLGKENFGIYIALTSLFSWMFLFDLGIAKGMRNFVTIAISNKNFKEAKEYISTAYILIFFIAIIAFIFIVGGLTLVDLQDFFNVPLDNALLQKIFFILLLGFFIKFYFSIVDQLNFAVHQSHNVALNDFLVAILNLTGIFLLWEFGFSQNIIYTIIVFSVAIVLPYIYSTIRFFKKQKELIPSIKSFSKKAISNIFSKGSKILFIQIGFLLIIGVDRIILLKYGSAMEVSKYEIVYKIMSIVIFPISIVAAPLWSSFTEAYNKNDINWIKKVFKKFYLLTLGLFIFIIFLTFIFNYITHFWLDDFPEINLFVIFMMGLLIMFLIWTNFHTDFLLGIQDLLYVIKMVFIGLVLKFGYLYYMISSESFINMKELIFSSILAYLFYSLSVPFYIKNLLYKKVNK